MRRASWWLLFAGALATTVLAGRWGMALFTTAEYVHFSVNFPTLPGSEQVPRERVGGPWTRLGDAEWSGYPAGGLLVWGREGQVQVDLGQRNFVKSWLQPGTLLLSTHWLRNVGTRPRRVALALDLCDLDVQWVTFEREWDAATHAFTRVLMPGQTGNMDWIVRIPSARLDQPEVCRGLLRVLDADSGALLTELPIVIGNSSARGQAP